MEFDRLSVPDVILTRPKVFEDDRGFFLEFWQQRQFTNAGVAASFVQANHSHSVRNTLRGLHYQVQQPQGKLVRVVAGEVFDVAVDLRRSSSTFGRWAGAILSASNRCGMWIPPGFAHGFLVLSQAADFVYLCTDYYAPTLERTLLWNDPQVAIAWPEGTQPLLSSKDAAGTPLQDAEVFP